MTRTIVRSLKWRFSAMSRKRKARHIKRYIAEHQIKTAVLVGATRRKGKVPGLKRTDGAVEDAVGSCARILGSCDIKRGMTPFPFVVGDGRALPFQSGSVDLVFSNAVIEHVGGEAEQRRFVREASRVGRHWIITTPNRWFPVESHTNAVFRHWRPSWRASKPWAFTRLLSRSEFADLLPQGSRIIGRPWSATFIAMGLGTHTDLTDGDVVTADHHDPAAKQN